MRFLHRGGMGVVWRVGMPHSRTYLLELELSPPTNVGIGIEGRDDATLNGGGIHHGRFKPMLASKALRRRRIGAVRYGAVGGEGMTGSRNVEVEGWSKLRLEKIWAKIRPPLPSQGPVSPGVGHIWI
jgi:hypothetical protein